MTERPKFGALTADDARALLARHHVGRLAFTVGGKADIEPIHYTFRDEWIYCRTSAGTKLTALTERPWVAFEVDEVEGPFDWRSVVIHGTMYPITDHPSDAEARAEAAAAVREFNPAAFTPDDPVPERAALVRIYVHDLAGRRATTRP
jgi:nitroimidazol reductase NimA-like FMN-containing flavoprotein (pyridoxamine 5'-phosphate oxidase superfamily)